jgi:hypothetical protein
MVGGISGIITMGEAKRKKASRAGALAPAAPEYPGEDWNAASMPAVVQGKSCGSCTKCCTVLGIPELKKAAWDECAHVAAGLGCKIYSDRPRSCRKFICGWLLDPNMGPDLKPENCHVVFHQRNEQHIIASCDPAYPDAWRKPNVIEFLHHLARSLGSQRKVVLMEKGRIWFVTEDAIVPTDMG